MVSVSISGSPLRIWEEESFNFESLESADKGHRRKGLEKESSGPTVLRVFFGKSDGISDFSRTDSAHALGLTFFWKKKNTFTFSPV